MPRPKSSRAVVPSFKGMNLSMAPSRLPPGLGTMDANGTRSKPFIGSWRPRHGTRRMASVAHNTAALPTGAVLVEGSSIVAIYQFHPSQSWAPLTVTVGSSPHIGDSSETSTIIALTAAGNLVAHSDMQPRGAIV